jgi:oligoribonuclease (3'-5' exoribonuclease)
MPNYDEIFFLSSYRLVNTRKLREKARRWEVSVAKSGKKWREWTKRMLETQTRSR